MSNLSDWNSAWPGYRSRNWPQICERLSELPFRDVALGLGVRAVDGVVLGADLVVEGLVGAGGVRGRDVRRPAIQLEHELASGSTPG